MEAVRGVNSVVEECARRTQVHRCRCALRYCRCGFVFVHERGQHAQHAHIRSAASVSHVPHRWSNACALAHLVVFGVAVATAEGELDLVRVRVRVRVWLRVGLEARGLGLG